MNGNKASFPCHSFFFNAICAEVEIRYCLQIKPIYGILEDSDFLNKSTDLHLESNRSPQTTIWHIDPPPIWAAKSLYTKLNTQEITHRNTLLSPMYLKRINNHISHILKNSTLLIYVSPKLFHLPGHSREGLSPARLSYQNRNWKRSHCIGITQKQ